MTSFNEMKKLLETRALNESFSKVYLEENYETQYKRFLEVLDAFNDLFNKDAQRDVSLFSAPGRTEFGGNHTDHNHGLVLAGGISLDAIAVAAKNDDGIIRIKSAGYPMDEVDCSDLEVKAEEEGRSKAIVRGIAARLRNLVTM